MEQAAADFIMVNVDLSIFRVFSAAKTGELQLFSLRHFWEEERTRKSLDNTYVSGLCTSKTKPPASTRRGFTHQRTVLCILRCQASNQVHQQACCPAFAGFVSYVFEKERKF
jgi:hypothetical protein